MSRLTEPLIPQTARAVKDVFNGRKWHVFAEGEDKKSYCIATFEKEELARKFSAEWNLTSGNSGWSRHASMASADPYREIQSWEDMFRVERQANERLQSDNQLLRDTLVKTLAEMGELKKALQKMEENHRQEIRELERSVMREMTESHREGFLEGRDEARREFDERD